MTRRAVGAVMVAAAMAWVTSAPAGAERLPTGGVALGSHTSAPVGVDCPPESHVEHTLTGYAHGGPFGAHDREVSIYFDLFLYPSGCDTLDRGRGTLSGTAYGETDGSFTSSRRPAQVQAFDIDGTYDRNQAILELTIHARDLELKMCRTDYTGYEECDVRTGEFTFKVDLAAPPHALGDRASLAAGTWTGRPS